MNLEDCDKYGKDGEVDSEGDKHTIGTQMLVRIIINGDRRRSATPLRVH
jgi:hypothetical protein